MYDLVYYLSGIITFCAFIYTVYSNRKSYKHKKISVQPLLGMKINYEQINDERTVYFEIINGGMGPAIIKNFILLYEGKEVCRNDYHAYNRFFKKPGRPFEVLNLRTFSPDCTIMVNEECEFFSFISKRGKEISFMSKLSWRIEYQSMYKDEIFICDSTRDDNNNYLF